MVKMADAVYNKTIINERSGAMVILSPDVFGPKHVSGSVFIIVLVYALLMILRHQSTAKAKRTLKVSAILLLGLEVFKYTFAIITRGRLSKSLFPFNLCSYFLYTIPIVAFGKGKVRAFVMPFTYTVGIVASLLVFIYPSTVLGNARFWIPVEGDLLPYQSFLYHGLMLFSAIFLVRSKVYKPRLSDMPKVFIMLIGMAAMSGTINIFLETDYMFLRTASGNPFQFLLTEYNYLAYMGMMLFLGIILILLTYLPYIPVRKWLYSVLDHRALARETLDGNAVYLKSHNTATNEAARRSLSIVKASINRFPFQAVNGVDISPHETID